ncbi:hypothetical protein B0H14DRAFT_2662644 [Mycena olivaceomarginata]|nr:hypothetical protein B0H14DRAFT_2662644 [Mycena olivaceomarginata]
MATQPMGETGHQLWDDTLNRLTNLSNATMKRNTFLEARVAELEMEAALWQRAHTVALEASERDGEAHQRLVCNLNKQIFKRDLFENQDPLILCVVNGDEKLFNTFAQGQEGGKFAAKTLTQEIATYLSADQLHKLGRISFWITVYFNRSELLDRPYCQCSPRFSLVDVGCTNDTGTKIREYIETYTRFPQTLRNEQLLGKLVMVNSDDAEGGSTSSFPSLKVQDGLFMNHKLQQRHTPLNMRGVNSNGGLLSPQSPASHISGRAIDLSLPLHKRLSPKDSRFRSLIHGKFAENPPPCNEHYLMTCSKGPAVCKYSHEYILTQDQLASLASNAKKAPCNWLKNGMFHLSKGKCWFKGEAMHPALPPELPPI